MLAEVTLSGRQDEPWTRRVCADGAVWEHTNLRTWVQDGAVRQEHQPLQWQRVTTAPDEPLEGIQAIIRRYDLMSAEPPPTATTTFGAGITTWRLGLDGDTHEIRLENVAIDAVPGLRELDEMVQLAVAAGLSPD